MQAKKRNGKCDSTQSVTGIFITDSKTFSDFYVIFDWAMCICIFGEVIQKYLILTYATTTYDILLDNKKEPGTSTPLRK